MGKIKFKRDLKMVRKLKVSFNLEVEDSQQDFNFLVEEAVKKELLEENDKIYNVEVKEE